MSLPLLCFPSAVTDLAYSLTARQALVKRRDALDARGERLRVANALVEQRRGELELQWKEVEEDE